MNLFEYLYYLGLSAKKFVSLKNRRRLPFRVISVGNITVGGTGKTPAAIAIAEEAQKRGLQPIILTRGYKGKAEGPCFVTKGEGPLLTVRQAGDEPFLMAERLRGVPIIKGADRYEAGMYALKQLKAPENAGVSGSPVPNPRTLTPVFILDDGFQHWSLFRDKDIVLIDARNPFGNRRLLPAGRLREPLPALQRADVVVITRAEREDSGLIADVRKYNLRAPIFFSHHRAVSVQSASGERKPVSWLKGKKVFCFCGLADPESFGSTVSSAGAEVTGMKTYRDHHAYAQKDIDAVMKECSVSGASWVFTTAKDMVKLAHLDLPGNILIIEIAFTADPPFFDSVFA